MGINKNYISMCSVCSDLQRDKYDEGFKEGDFVFTGDKVRVIGHDFIGVRGMWAEQRRPVFYFAMQEEMSPKAVFNQELPTGNIEVKKGKYIIEKIHRPVWVPRLDQLIEKIRSDLDEVDVLRNIIIKVDCGKFRGKSYTSYEELFLAYYMRKRFNVEYKKGHWEAYGRN